jgi:hypothetical protein
MRPTGSSAARGLAILGLALAGGVGPETCAGAQQAAPGIVRLALLPQWAVQQHRGNGGSLLEAIDGGATYRFNPNLVFNLFGGVMLPDEGDMAWAITFRTQYSF